MAVLKGQTNESDLSACVEETKMVEPASSSKEKKLNKKKAGNASSRERWLSNFDWSSDDWSSISELSIVTRWYLWKLPRYIHNEEEIETNRNNPEIQRKISLRSWRKEDAERKIASIRLEKARALGETENIIVCRSNDPIPIQSPPEDRPLVRSKENVSNTCTVCQKTFSVRSSLMNHQRRRNHHDWKWKCPHCDKPFSETKFLKRHCSLFHPDMPAPRVG